MSSKEILMKTVMLALGVLGLATFLGATDVAAKPGGCLKYGAAGAVAGHYAGHHAVKGAVAGCIAGMVRRHEYNKEMKREKAEAATKTEEQNRTLTGTPATDTPATSAAPQSH
jgi:hypothetical protein